MLLNVPFKYYSSLLQKEVNKPVSLERLLQPFRLQASSVESSFLLVGHILDALSSQWEENRTIDVFDVTSTAWELGYDEAEEFLEKGPYLIYQLLKDEV